MHRKRLAAELCSNPLRSSQRSPGSLVAFRGGDPRKGKREGRDGEREGRRRREGGTKGMRGMKGRRKAERGKGGRMDIPTF